MTTINFKKQRRRQQTSFGGAVTYPAGWCKLAIVKVRSNTIRKIFFLLLAFLGIYYYYCMSLPQRLQQQLPPGSPKENLLSVTRNDHHIIPFPQYEIPPEMIPNDPVKVRIRLPYEKENSRISSAVAYKAYQEYGEEIRQLLRMEEAKTLLQKANTVSSSSAGSTSSSSKASSLAAFHKRLSARAPWLKKGDGLNNTSLSSLLMGLPKPVQGKAIIICAGDKQITYLRSIVYSIRVLHQSPIPIRIVYRDDDDLSIASREALAESVPDGFPKELQFINLANIFDLKAANLKAGWNLKPFGLLAVAETEVVILDVDVILLQPPERLFEDKGYQNTGALFFHDRMFLNYLGFYDPGALAKALQSSLSQTANNIIHYGKTTYVAEHIMESGVVLIDKSRRMLGVWSICLLIGRQDIRDHAQALYIYGDKELYWIGFETVSEPYAFSRYYPGVYGSVATDFEGTDVAVKNNDESSKVGALYDQVSSNHYALCGRILHFDESGQPLWSNGGYFTKEEDWKSSSSLAEYPLNPVWYIDGGKWQEEDFLPHVPDGSVDIGFIRSWFVPKDNPIAHATLEQAFMEWKRAKNVKAMNQQWQTHGGMGVMCLLPNSRGIRQVPKELSDVATKATKHFFLTELEKSEYTTMWT